MRCTILGLEFGQMLESDGALSVAVAVVIDRAQRPPSLSPLLIDRQRFMKQGTWIRLTLAQSWPSEAPSRILELGGAGTFDGEEL